MTAAERAYALSVADSGEDRRQAIILEQLPQVYHIATRIHERLPRHVPLEDLVHEGVLGLMAALSNFDNSKQVQFQTYAGFRIRGAILDSLRKMDWASRPLRAKGRRVTNAIAELVAALGRQPSEQEIADHLGMPVAKLQRLLADLDGLMLLGQESFAPYDHSETQDLIETAPSKGDDDPFAQCLRGEVQGELAKSIALLSEREQLLLSLYYREELTMREVAEVIGVKQSRASQIHSMILLKLKAALSHVRQPHVPHGREHTAPTTTGTTRMTHA
ncbi:MAG TPA: FliA/WhiG family RNA polymerase sigma factor [Terracidiphilus sp.]|nr:FliA/WhiG family RNA polymerase sigma factor [Terracidiphilus sp.]